MSVVHLVLPFDGRWRVQNSPARRVPSHGTDLFGGSYAIDFVGVDERGRTAHTRDWRTLLATEAPERFVGFGRPILAPIAGRVVAVHDGEVDHEARRSPVTLAGYALSQASRVRGGPPAIAGNHVTIAKVGGDGFVVLAHLQRGSIVVSVGDRVADGQPVARCGNSGNSTQPHLHLQAMDDADPSVARGLPISFRRFRERARRSGTAVERRDGVPADGAVVEPFVPPGRGP
jgi:murein DD-endopeptidase MepM/ murein hydrolase activator NlpD